MHPHQRDALSSTRKLSLRKTSASRCRLEVVKNLKKNGASSHVVAKLAAIETVEKRINGIMQEPR